MADVRLIDANALLKEIEDWHDSLGGTMNPADWGIQNVLQSVMDNIVEAEDIDAAPVRHGRWIEIRDKYNYRIGMKCSECKRKVRSVGENYCPNCGAKMDAKEG